MVRENGYPFELHHVTTKDGYILALHRIPSNDPNDNGQNQRQRVALVMHGLLGCSADWLINGKNQSIGRPIYRAYIIPGNAQHARAIYHILMKTPFSNH